MKIMTYNICHCAHFVHKGMDYPAFADVIKKYSPNIIGLNEVRNMGEEEHFDNQPQILSDLTGIQNYLFAEAIKFRGNNPYGNGMLSTEDILSHQVIMIPDPEVKKYDGYYETRCILKVKFKNGLTVLITHFGLNPDEHELAVKTVLDNLEDSKCILMGDFNMTPDNPLIKKLGDRLVDTAKYFTTPKFSFPSTGPEIKIDYIYVTKDIKVKSADIVPDICSDHNAYVVEIDF